MKLFDKLFRICLMVFSLTFTAQFSKKKTDTFTIQAISSNRPYQERFQTHELTNIEQDHLETALSQPYRYFGWGGQAYVFFSSDDKYVIKFFKQRLFRPSWLLNHLPLPKIFHKYRFKKNWKRLDKLTRDFFSYQACFDELQDETALLYCHLNKSSHLKKKIEIVDRIGIHHFLDLDDFDFIVQRRAERVCERIPRLLEAEDFDGIKKTFQQILTLTNSCINKGFYNRDPYIPNNCGLLENRAIQIDVGRFIKKESIQTEEGQKAEFLRITAPFTQWIHSNFPELLPLYQEQLRKVF